MRYRSWHKWLFKGLIFVVAGFVLGILSCRDQNTAAPSQQPAVVISSVAWTYNGTPNSRIGEKDFRALAEEARQSFAPMRRLPCRVIIVGELNVINDRGTLYLDAQAQTDRTDASIKTGIAAEGLATDAAMAKLLVRKSLKDLFAAVGELVALAQSTPAKWIKALQDPEPDMQLLALRLLGKHSIRRGVVPIANLLGDPREQVSEAAAAALGDIGDPAAVPLLIKSIERGNLRSEVRAIEAMGRIGGPEANAYLEMTALGHEVPEVRRLSAMLLKRANSL